MVRVEFATRGLYQSHPDGERQKGGEVWNPGAIKPERCFSRNCAIDGAPSRRLTVWEGREGNSHLLFWFPIQGTFWAVENARLRPVWTV